jgi:hypothetical protein
MLPVDKSLDISKLTALIEQTSCFQRVDGFEAIPKTEVA